MQLLRKAGTISCVSIIRIAECDRLFLEQALVRRLMDPLLFRGWGILGTLPHLHGDGLPLELPASSAGSLVLCQRQVAIPGVPQIMGYSQSSAFIHCG